MRIDATKLAVARDVLDTLAKHVLAQTERAFELHGTQLGGTFLIGRADGAVEGDMSGVETPATPCSAHTHAISNYVHQDCFVGWPSGEDMRWVTHEAVSQRGAFRTHLCVALEGTYAITVNPSVVALAALDADELAAVLGGVYLYFSSRHGHRCGDGATLEKFPCALYFMRLARDFSFEGPVCEQHAGADEECEPPCAARSRAASLVPGTVFSCAFIPHRLRCVEPECEYSYTDLVRSPESHRRRIHAGKYSDVRVAGTPHITISPSRGWTPAPAARTATPGRTRRATT
jgi:hypothetical protein